MKKRKISNLFRETRPWDGSAIWSSGMHRKGSWPHHKRSHSHRPNNSTFPAPTKTKLHTRQLFKFLKNRVRLGDGWHFFGVVHNQQHIAPHWSFKTRATCKKQHGCETICLGKGRGVTESNGIFRDVLVLPINPPAGHNLIPTTVYQALPSPFVACRDFLTTPSTLGMVWLPSSSRTGSDSKACQQEDKTNHSPASRHTATHHRPVFQPGKAGQVPSYWKSSSQTAVVIHESMTYKILAYRTRKEHRTMPIFMSTLASYQILPRIVQSEGISTVWMLYFHMAYFFQAMWVVRQVKHPKSCPLCLFKIWTISKKNEFRWLPKLNFRAASVIGRPKIMWKHFTLDT